MKTMFFSIFDPIWSNILAPKDPTKEVFKQNFSFESIKKTSCIVVIFMTLRLTNNTEILEINQFLTIFDPIQAKI